MCFTLGSVILLTDHKRLDNQKTRMLNSAGNLRPLLIKDPGSEVILLAKRSGFVV